MVGSMWSPQGREVYRQLTQALLDCSSRSGLSRHRRQSRSRPRRPLPASRHARVPPWNPRQDPLPPKRRRKLPPSRQRSRPRRGIRESEKCGRRCDQWPWGALPASSNRVFLAQEYNGMRLRCDICHTALELAKYDPNREYSCPECGNSLIPRDVTEAGVPGMKAARASATPHPDFESLVPVPPEEDGIYDLADPAESAEPAEQMSLPQKQETDAHVLPER